MEIRDKIIIVEDESSIINLLKTILRANNYDVLTAATGAEAGSMITSHCPDLVILDLGLPDMDGIQILKDLRAWSSIPVIVLSARTHERDKVEALDLGADDYITKPFGTSELLARIRSMTRRQPELSDSVLKFGNLSLDRSDYELAGPDGSTKLANKEFQIMEMLMTNPGQVISTERFLEKIWGYDTDAEVNVVWVYISTLRKKLASLGASVQIKAARGVGYSLEDNA